MEDEDNVDNGVLVRITPTDDEESDSSEASYDDGIQILHPSRLLTTHYTNSLHVTFDNALPMKHSYLGDNLEEVSGRTLLEEGSLHILPLLIQPGIVLVPGQTLPLTVFAMNTIHMLRQVLATDRTFGVACLKDQNSESRDSVVADTGTTAEIYAWHEKNDNPHHIEFRVKALGRQRFRIVKLKAGSKPPLATVMILSERTLPDMLRELRPRALSGSKRSAVMAKSAALCTAWPAWVHDQYNTDKLVAKLKHRITALYSRADLNLNMPDHPVQLSYWAAQGLPMQDDQRLKLLKIDSAIQRLRVELSLIDHCQVLCCGQCHQHIADTKDIFSMSAEGPQGTFVNPGGHVHETMTVHRARGLLVHFQQPSYEYSWFPGYAWTMVSCNGCEKHMGWLFTTKQSKLRPKRFFGLCRNSLTVNVRTPNEGDELQPEPSAIVT